MFLPISFLVFLSFVHTGVNGKSDLTKKIQDGHFTSIKHFPYTVGVVGGQDRYKSSGFIYNRRTIITAGSWLRFVYERNVRLITGDTIDERSTSNVVQRIIRHQDFNKNGLAILCLRRKLRFTDNVNKADISTKEFFGRSDKAYVSGWDLEDTPDRHNYTFKFASVNLLSPSECEAIKKTFDSRKEICGETYRHIHCKGDSGTPLAVNKQIVGLYTGSEFSDCDKDNTYFYLRVRSYMDFIEKNDCQSWDADTDTDTEY